jgi:hypothetical protein
MSPNIECDKGLLRRYIPKSRQFWIRQTMPNRLSKTGSDLFIVDNSDT